MVTHPTDPRVRCWKCDQTGHFKPQFRASGPHPDVRGLRCDEVGHIKARCRAMLKLRCEPNIPRNVLYNHGLVAAQQVIMVSGER